MWPSSRVYEVGTWREYPTDDKLVGGCMASGGLILVFLVVVCPMFHSTPVLTQHLRGDVESINWIRTV